MPSDEDSLHYMEANHRPGAPQMSVASPDAEDRKLLGERESIPMAPRSSGVRLSTRANDTIKKQPPRLLHPTLHGIPIHIRFGLNGFISNVGFMVAYNMAVVRFQEQADASTIYSIVYLIFIPVSHALLSLLVFGWPDRYVPSLMSNAPIGLTAIALGAMLTAYLDRTGFNKLAVDRIAEAWTSLGYESIPKPEEETGEFYSSLLVLIITGIWTFVLSVIVNSPSESSEKKEN